MVIRCLSKFIHDEQGATAIEYALMCAFLAIAIVTAVTSLGTRLSSEFTEISGTLK